MSKPEEPVQKSHVSGSWRVVRSTAVPANVTPELSIAPPLHQSGSRRIHKVEETVVKPRKHPGYFETVDHLVSKA